MYNTQPYMQIYFKKFVPPILFDANALQPMPQRDGPPQSYKNKKWW